MEGVVPAKRKATASYKRNRATAALQPPGVPELEAQAGHVPMRPAAGSAGQSQSHDVGINLCRPVVCHDPCISVPHANSTTENRFSGYNVASSGHPPTLSAKISYCTGPQASQAWSSWVP